MNSQQLSFDKFKRQRKKSFIIIAALFVTTILLAAICLSTGEISVPLKSIFAFFTEKIDLFSGVASDTDKYIISDLRLPRICMAIVAGVVLASAGAAMQGVFRNPLAEPGILGVTSGAGLGAALIIVLGSEILPNAGEFVSFYSIPIGAFLGALIVTVALYFIGTYQGRTNTALLLLGAIAIQAIIGSALGYLTFVSTDEELRNFTFWSMGSLDFSTWKEVSFIAPVCFFCYVMIHRQAKALNAVLLGESEAVHLGINIQGLKIQLIIWTALSVGIVTAFTGGISFIGLAAPHMVRLVLGPDHRMLFPASALCGACLLLIADTLARTIMPPSELPIGIITAAIGAPFLLSLVFKVRKRGFSL